MVTSVHARTEEALEFLIEHCTKIPVGSEGPINTPRQAHVWIPDLAFHFWRLRNPEQQGAELTVLQCKPLYDAAWELARIAVLRPGRIAPRGKEHPQDFGDAWTITEFGFAWLADAGKRPFTDISRISHIFASFVPQFGQGFAQRSVEAIRCHRTGNHLSACVMAGAAAESILLAVAIAKSGDEPKTLRQYESAGGRARVVRAIAGQSTPSVARQFESALHVLHYWRDDASHGLHTTISEVEAHASISELLRLAQFTSDQWDSLTQ